MVKDARDGMPGKAQSASLPRGTESICKAAGRRYRLDGTVDSSVSPD